MITKQYLKDLIDNYESNGLDPISLELEADGENTKIIARFLRDDYESNEAWLEDFLSDNNIFDGYDLDIEECNGQVNHTVIFSNEYLEENEMLASELVDVTNANKDSNAQQDIKIKEPAKVIKPVQSVVQNTTVNKAAFVTNQNAQPTRINTSEKKISAFKQVQAFITDVIPKLTDDNLTSLMSKEYCKANAGLGYPLLLEVDSNILYKDQVKMNGKSRYAKRPIIINNRSFYITNHLFDRNVIRIKNMLDSF